MGLPPKVPRPHLRNGHEILLLGAVGLGYRNGDVGLLEGGNLVVTGNLGIDLVSRTVGQVQMQSLWPFADQNSLLCQGDSRGRRDAGIGDEDTLPDGCTLGSFHVLNVEHESGETLV